MKNIFTMFFSKVLFVTVLLSYSFSVNATICPNASVIAPGSLPIIGQAIVCGATDDISAASAAASVVTGGCAGTAYFGGQEALYSFTPAASGQYDVSYAGQTWSAIFVFNGCPTTGGSTCVGGITGSAASKSVTVTLTAGVTYYIMFDTWPTPNSPCPGTFSLTQILPNTATATINGGLWSSPQTWVSGMVPNAASTVIIPSGSIVVVDQLTNIASLDVTGNLQWNATSNAMTVLGNITVNAGGKFLPYTTAAGGTTLVGINVGGDFINNGYCNFAAGATTANFLNFNGSQQAGGSLTQTLSGTGVFEGNGVKGIIRAIAFQTTGNSTINTSQDLITMSIAHTNGSLNTNGKLTIDNTAQCFGQAMNTQVSSVSVTNMGSLYSTSPVVCGVAVTPYANAAIANLGTRYFYGNNVYLCTAAGTFNATPPTSNTLNTTFTTSGPTLLYVGTLGTLGANVPYNGALSLTTPYFYGDNWYQAVVATATTTMPTHVAGTVGGFRYLGPAAKVSVNFDPVSQTVRSLTLTNQGSGWNSATAPLLVFSAGAVGATGSGAAATPVVLYNLNGPLNSLIQKSGIATFTGGLTINSDQGASIASADPQASSGVGNLYTTNGGLNYTVAPTVGFAGPPTLNLVTNQGSGYAVAPTVVVTGGTLISGTALGSANFTVTVNQGKVVSVYLNTGTTATYSVPPTISLSAGTATIAWPANCWPTATANIGSNGQLLSFTITNAGYGYNAAPIAGVGTVSGTAAGGTFTTAATAPLARVALYNVTIANFTPVTTLAVQNDVDIFPSNRKINSLSLSTGGLGLNLTNNLTLIGTAPLTLTASPNGTGNILNLNTNTLTCTWNGYAGTTSTFGASNVYLQNGSMAIYGRGGGATGSTYNFPFSAYFSVFTGNGSAGVTGGSDITKTTVTETSAPSNAITTGTGLVFGNRAFRLQGNSFQSNPGISGINPTVTLRYNSQDGLTSTQDQTYVNQAPLLTGAWNVVSAAYGISGALPATGQIVTPTIAPGPVYLDGDDFFAWGTNAPTLTNVAPLSLCAGSGQFTITGTNLSGVTSVLIGGTPVANFSIISSTQIDAYAGLGTSGVVSIVANGATFSGAQAVTINASPLAPTPAPSSVTVMLGVTANFTVTGAGGTYNWYNVPFGGTSIGTGASFTTPANCATTSYYVAESNGSCEGPRSQVIVNVTPISFTASVPNLCGNGGNVTLTATPNDPSITYNWTSNQPSAVIAPGTSSVTTASLTETSDFFLAATANGCTYNANPISIGVYGFPAITPTATPSVLCDSGMVALASGITPGNFSAICITPNPQTVPANSNYLVTNGVATVPQTSGGLDDGGWGAIPIGFNFNYFGTAYSTINVGTNGVLQFGAYNATALGDFTIGALPNAIDPTNAIFGCAHDLHCGYAGANLNYWTAGIAPNRKFVINYQIWQYGGPATPVNFQIILKETTGQVEIVATNVLSTAGKTIGVNNPTGTIGAAAPNCSVAPNTPNYWQAQTATIPSTSPQAWRFNPPVNYLINWSVNGVGNPATAQLNGVTVNTSSTNQMTYATTPYQVYIQDPITNCSQVYQAPVTVNPSPGAPVATNSTQCGLGTPTASVVSTAGANGNGQFFWFNAASNGLLVQTPPTGAYTTFYSDNFSGASVAAGGSISGTANLLNYPGQLQLFDNNLSQIGGLTVAAGVNASAYMVDFDLITSTGADGVSYSFGDDVNANAVTPSQEMGSGSKVKISFDAYGAMPNGQGIYLLYNNTLASFDNTSPGVLAYSTDISWVNDTNHVSLMIDNAGKVTLAVGATTIFNGVQLPPAYLAANKSTWSHVISGRTGGISMLATIDNLLIQYANNTPGYTSVQTPINTTTTYYVTEQGTNGCLSALTPLTVTVVNPDPITITPGATADICIGQSISINGTSTAANPYTYSWDANTYNGSGFNSPLSGASQTITPTTSGAYTLTITGTNGVCTATSTLALNVNALPNITSATAGPLGVCNNSTINLAATSFVTGPQTLPGGYCATNNSGGAGSMIDDVVFNTISYNSAANQPPFAPFYTATNLTTTVNAGQTYPLSVTVGPAGIYSGAIVSVWIDFDRDGVYAPTEWQQVSTNMTNTTTTINITIPVNAQPGLTGMRIRSRGAFNINDAMSSCMFMGSGETEDYQVNIQIPPVNPFTYTWNAVPSVTGANATTVGTNLTPSNISVNYIVTALDATTGCTNTDTTNNVTIYPAILPPTVTNSAHCGIQIPTATANDVNGFVGPNYNWYASAINSNALQSSAANTYGLNIGATTTLYVAVEDTLTGCETVSTPVTITVTPGPSLSLASSLDSICVGSTTSSIGLTAGGATYNSYTWSPAIGVSGNEITGWTFNPAVSTVYTLTATQTGLPNCSNQDTINIQVDQIVPPAPAVPQSIFNVCTGTNSVLLQAGGPVVNNTFTYTLNFYDSFGDGWNGNTINVNVNGNPVLNGVTLANGSIGSLTFTVTSGNLITAQFNAIGSWIGECTYDIVDNNGNVIFSGTPASAGGPPNLTTPYIVPGIPQPNYVVNWYNASTNGANVGTGSPFQSVGTTIMPTTTAGSYIFYAGLSLGACNSTTVPVTVNVADVVATLTATNTCIGQTNGSFTATNFLCGTSPYSYSVNNGPFGAIPTNLAAGPHTVVIRDANLLLSSTYNITVGVDSTIPPAPVVPQSVFNACSGTNSVLIAANAPVNLGTQTYTLNFYDSFGDGWNNNTINVYVNGVAVLNGVTLPMGFNGTATFTVSGGDSVTTQFNPIGSWVGECTYDITNAAGAVIFSGTPASGFGPPNLNPAHVVPLPAQPNYVINWYNASSNGTYVGTGSPFETVGSSVMPLSTNGTYMFYAGTSLGACNSATTIPVTVNIADVSATITPINATCNGVANGSFTATNFTCGTAPFVYSVNNGPYGSIPNNLAAGNHTVVIRDANNLLSSTYNITIGQPAWSINAPISPANGTACVNDLSEIISASATIQGQTQVIVDTFFLATNVFFAQGAGGSQSFTQNVTLPAGVTVTGTTLSVNNVTTSNFGWPADYNISLSGASTLNSTTLANINAEVSNAGPYLQTPTLIGNNGGNVTVTLQNTYPPGVGFFGSVELIVTYTMPASVSNITWWNAPTAGNQEGAGFSLESVGTTVLPNTLTPGVYNFYAQGEANGCSSLTRTLVTVTVNALPNVNAGLNQALCIGQSTSLTATGATTYTWNNGITNGTTFTPNVTNTYIVNGVDGNGCTNQDTVTVVVNPLPNVSAGNNQTVCLNTPVVLSGSGASTYVWTNGVTNNTPFTPITTNNYIVTGTDVNGCVNSDTVTVTVLPLPIVNAGQDYAICGGMGATLTASGANSYQWNNNVLQGVTFFPYTTQTYTVIGTGANGCSSQDSVQVTVNTTPTISLTSGASACANGTVALNATATGAFGGFWSSTNGGGSFTPNVSNANVTYNANVNDPAVVTFVYVAFNQCGASNDTATINILGLPSVNAGNDAMVCSGSSATLTAIANGNVVWDNGILDGVPFSVNPGLTTYIATATGANGCTNTDTVEITGMALPQVNAGNDQTICAGDFVTLNASGAVSYSWDNNVIDGAPFAPSTTATYTVTGTGANGCDNTDNVTVTVNALPNAGVVAADPVTLVATPAGMTYQWINCATGQIIADATNDSLVATANGSYGVIVTNANGCLDTSNCVVVDQVGIYFPESSIIALYPNPTSDFITLELPATEGAIAHVYDAQGKLVFSYSNAKNGQKFDLSTLSTGVYTFRITLNNLTHIEKVIKQ